MENGPTIKERVTEFFASLAEKVKANVETQIKIEITIGSVDADSTIQELPDLEGLSLPDLYELRNETQDKIDEFQEDEPEDYDSDEYEEWEDALDTLSEFLDDIDDRIEELEAEEKEE